jgi:hypothetical protein
VSMLTPLGKGLGTPPTRRRRGHNRRLKVLVAIALVLAVGAGGWWWLNRDSRPDTATTRRTCPSVAPAPTIVPAAAVKLNVFNGTARKGLASLVAEALKKRGFVVLKVANDPLKRRVTGLAEVRSGPAGKDAARTVTAQVGPVVALPDQRKDASVDLVIGSKFAALRTPAQATAALKPTPAPRPSGCA